MFEIAGGIIIAGIVLYGLGIGVAVAMELIADTKNPRATLGIIALIMIIALIFIVAFIKQKLSGS